ncbi:MAG: riboflavin synthase [Calditrichia bacterium]
MFTGIIEEIGQVTKLERIAGGIRLEISADTVLEDLQVGDSICIDGACQTVVKKSADGFTVEAVGETLQKTTLGSIIPGHRVNLERPLTLQSRLGGHLVQGHVNAAAPITQLFSRGENYFLEIRIPSELEKYCIPEGSIAIDGISLTIAQLQNRNVGISIIPHTYKNTTLQYKKIGDKVNVEVDVIARYVEKLLKGSNPSGLSYEQMKKWGY